MKHKHSELINKWRLDTSLVVLYKSTHYRDWRKSSFQISPTWELDSEYFLVCEKHVEVALHWLNGGEVEICADGSVWKTLNKQTSGYNAEFYKPWEYRIKPKLEKVKVWIGIHEGDVIASTSSVAMRCDTGIYTWSEHLADKEVI